jgi:hypothetical protein
MARWSSGCGLFAVAIVALSCSGRDARAFALCDGCPDLFTNAPIAQQVAEPPAPSTRVHDPYVSRRRHQSRDVPSPPSLARRSALTAFAAVPIVMGATGANIAVVAEPAPGVADAELPATPALRIDHLFNIMAAGPSDRPEEFAALRANVLSQFRARQSSPDPDESTGFVVPTIFAFGGGWLLVGVALVSAGHHAFALPRKPGRRNEGDNSLTNRARRLTRRMRGNSLVRQTVAPRGGRESDRRPQAGAKPAGVRSREAWLKGIQKSSVASKN